MKLQIPQNKWFIAFVATAVIAVVAIVVAVILGIGSGAPANDGIGESIENAIYYYDVIEGEIVLTFSDGNKFTIAGPSTNKTGTYTVDGDVLTLDFFKDEDGTTTATIQGDTVTLVYDNATMSFQKKINYTVNFQVDGGSEINAVYVVNGKTVAQPADPVKKDHVFLGWYADEACTTPFDFSSTMVKSDLTVYARWAKSIIGGKAYTVELMLGYEGAEQLAPLATVGGQLLEVPVPERAGYTFGGWWISDYEDGQKLTYAYEEGMTFQADTTLYALWYEDGSTKLQAPAVSVHDNAISWNSIKDAKAYKLTIIDPAGNVVVDNETVNATVRAFDFANGQAGEYCVTVYAVANSEANNSESTVRYFANKSLDRVSDFTVVNGILIFGTVEHAQKYTISIDCGNDGHVHSAFDNGTSTTYYIGNCPMQEGGILVTVTASANGYASSVSKVFVYNRLLAPVEELVYDQANDMIVWGAVENTANYQVTVTVDGKSYTFQNGTSTSFSIAGFSGDITVSVQPTTNGYNSPAATEVTCKKTAPAAPGGLTASGMIITWDAVPGAVTYEVNIGGQNISVSTNQLDLTQASVALEQGKAYDVKVKAVDANNESSSYSEVTRIGYYGMDPILTYHRNTVYWTPVLGATEYQVRVNGGIIRNYTDISSVKVTLTQEGENLIEVRFVANGTASDWSSVTVNACAVEYDTRNIANGIFLVEYLAVGDLLSLPTTGFSYDGYQFTGWYNAPKGAAGNGMRYEEGDVFEGNAYTVIYAEWAPMDFEVILNTDGYNITNITKGQRETVTYTKDFVLPVPQATNTGMYIFAGWYTSPLGMGEQITDGTGKSVSPYGFTREINLYPYYSTDALKFVLQSDGTYGVYRGESISSVTNLEIPATYNNKPVTVILESAFNHISCANLVTISIPDTITMVGAGAFSACRSLESIDVYKAKDGVYETFYSSEDGVLIREDMGTTYLEFVPRAKTGTFTIPECVDRILTRAFYYSQITNIIIPNNVIDIPKYAFYNCASLKTITFETGRTNSLDIGDYAFYMCDSVESMILPAGFNVELGIFVEVLDMIPSLKSITVEKGGVMYASVGGMLTNREMDTIYYCPKSYAGAVTIAPGIVAIADKAFVGREKITSVTIPVWVTSVGNYAFESCTNLKEIVFKGYRLDDLTIGTAAFRYCSGVTKITFEGNGADELDTGKVTIGESAFAVNNKRSSDTSLTAVEIGDGVNIASIGTNAFYQQFKLREFKIADNAVIGVIGQHAFEKCERLVSFDVPAAVTNIGDYAFAHCTTLAAVNFRTKGATSLEIADYAFYGCTKLGQILLPDHLTQFKSAAFEGCDALKAILVNKTNPLYLNDDNGILYKKNLDGNGNPVLTELLFYPKGLARELGGVVNNLPETLTTIGGSAFASNKYLVSVTIPKNVTVIDRSAFANCDALETVNFAAGGTALVVNTKAFYGCTALKNFRLPSYTTEIGESAFENCEFTSFVIPEKVSSIGLAAFKNCYKLETLTFNTTVPLTISINGTSTTGSFMGCVALKNVNLPATLTELGKYAFYQCTGLERVTFGNTVKGSDGYYTTDAQVATINSCAFSRCYNLESIIIPKSVSLIGDWAFRMTDSQPGKLKEVVFERYGTTQLKINAEAFANQAELVSITLPARTRYIYNGSVTATSTTELEYYKVFLHNVSLAEINIDNDLVSGIGIYRYFASVDGVLYNGDKTAVLFCPAANVGRYVNGKPTYELVIPNTVKTVMTHAFQNLTKLKTLTFQEFATTDAKYATQLLTIGNFVFTADQSSAVVNKYCGADGSKLSAIGGNKETFYPGNSITTVNLPSHLAKINSAAFASNSETSMVININPDANNIVLADFAFVHSRASKIEIPGTVKSIGAHTFRESVYLKTASFNLPTTVTKLPDNVFHNCTSLETFVIPTHVKEIPQYAFYGCKALRTMNLPSNLTKLGLSAFSASGLETVTLPYTLTNGNVGNGVFDNCDNLTTVVFQKNASGTVPLTQLPNMMFQNCDNLVNINLHDIKLTSIGNNCFSRCGKLTGIDFTKFTSLSTIGTAAFTYTALTKVDLSKTKVSTITNAFSLIPTLETFVFPSSSVSSVSANVFKDDVNLKSVTLPKNFQAAWLKQFTSAAGANLFQPQCEVVVPSNATYLVMDEYGVIYDKAKQTILFVSGVNKDLSGYTMPNTVVTIENYAFAYTKADNLTLSEGVKTIGQYAFYHVDIPVISVSSTVETISARAFAYADTQNVVFANEHNSKLKTLSNYAFEYSKLERITLPDNLELTASDVYIFKDCYELRSVVIGAKTKIIPGRLVNNCYALEEIRFQEGLETINDLYIFYNSIEKGKNNQVTSITIPSTVKTLAAGAFAAFENLETVTIVDDGQLKTIGDGAFANCFSLKSINILSSVTSLGKEAFRDCYSLQAIDLAQTDIEIIPEAAFKNTHAMATLKLPNNVVTIGQYAFFNTGVVELNIPATVTSIGDYAFEDAVALKKITFAPDSMMEALGSLETDSAIFKGSVSLETVTLPNFMKTIGNYVFEGSGLREVLVTDTSVSADLRNIGEYAFANCKNLTNFEHLYNAQSIGNSAFLYCSALKDVQLHEGLDYIGAMAFGFCNQIASVRIPASVTELGGNPFAGFAANQITLAEGNTFFTTETDANGVLTIYDTAKSIVYGIYGAHGTYTIDQEANVVMPGALAGNAVTRVDLPARLNVYGDYLFTGCTQLTTVNLDCNLTAIGDYAFYNSGITTLQIPASVKTLGDYAFANCAALTKMTIPATVTKLGEYCFAYNRKLSQFTFEESGSTVTMGTHCFYNCPMITQVILPAKFQTTVKDAADQGQNSTYCSGAIPSYTFAGTGIVNAVLPEFVTCYYTEGVFAGCKSLEVLTLTKTNSAAQSYGMLNGTWFDGCTKTVYAYAETMTDEFAATFESLSKAGILEFRTKAIALSDVASNRFGIAARLYLVSGDMKVYVTGQSYKEMIALFEVVQSPWKLQIFDKDGNRLICSEEDGTVAYVVDAKGNTIWKTAEN